MKNQCIKTTLAGLAVSTMITGCMSTTKVDNPVDIISNPAYVVSMPDADIMPSKSELKGAKTRVVVLPVRITNEMKLEAGAVREVSSLLENSLLDASVEIIDRSLAGTLGDEIVAYEATGTFSGSGLDLADIAILPTVSKADAVSEFSAATYGQYPTPAKCNYSATVRGNIKMYKMPELTALDAITLDGAYSNSADTVSANCNFNEGTLRILTSNAMAAALDDTVHLVKNNFSQSGFVLDYRKRDSTHLVQISMGKDQGIKAGQKIEFARKLSQTNRLTGETKVSDVPYGFIGTVSDLVEIDNAWVIIDDGSASEGTLRFGDIARQKYEEMSIFEKTMNQLSR